MAWQEYQPAHGHGKEGDIGQVGGREPTPKQCPVQREDGMQRMKAQRPMCLSCHKSWTNTRMYSRTRQTWGNGKCVKTRKVVDLDRSGVWTQGLGITYLYLANIGEVDHRSEVWDGVVWRWGEGGSLFWSSRSNSFGEKCPAGMTSHPKEVNMS